MSTFSASFIMVFVITAVWVAVDGETDRSDMVTLEGRAIYTTDDIMELLPCDMQLTEGNEMGVDCDQLLGNGRCRHRQPQRTASSDGERRKRNVISSEARKWPTKTIAYQFNSGFTFAPNERTIFLEAVADYDKYTCINFVERTDEMIYLDLRRQSGCSSFVGFVRSFAEMGQPINLVVGCIFSKRIPIHELYHALGAFHQQSRPDRNNFVEILFDNIEPNRENNFVIRNDVLLYETPYSYRSIMHYFTTTFGNLTGVGNTRLVTVRTLQPEFQNIIGRGQTFSFEDLVVLNRHYTCDDNCAGPNLCSTNPLAYRGEDCNCYCDNDDVDPNDPVVMCAPIPLCMMVDLACQCDAREGTCNDLTLTTCNTISKACECIPGSVLFGEPQTCTLLSSIECVSVMEDCRCSLQEENPCSDLPNTECVENKCVCFPNTTLENGTCVPVSQCSMIDTPCMCSNVFGGCAEVNHTICHEESGECRCGEGRVADGESQTCTLLTDIVCDTLEEDCKCGLKEGESPCSDLPNTICNNATNACQCAPNFSVNSSGICELMTECLEIDTPCMCSSREDACDNFTRTICQASEACECASGLINVNGECTEDIPCTSISQSCQCTFKENPCADLPQSTCNQMTNACGCNAGTVLFGSLPICTPLTDIPCDALNADCRCSFQNSTACPTHSECEMETNRCVCGADFMENDSGECAPVADHMCDTLGENCSCSVSPSTACAGIVNSTCSLTTDACECDEDFIAENGTCVAAPVCDTLGENCSCSFQGADACVRFPGSTCNVDTESCECRPSFLLRNLRCRRTSRPLFCTVGSETSEFLPSANSFTPVGLLEPATVSRGNMTQDHPLRNGFQLQTSGVGAAEFAEICTRTIRIIRGICVDYIVQLTNAEISVIYKPRSSRFNPIVVHAMTQESGTSTHTLRSIFFNQPIAVIRRFRRVRRVRVPGRVCVRASQSQLLMGDASWSVLLDNLSVRKCRGL